MSERQLYLFFRRYYGSVLLSLVLNIGLSSHSFAVEFYQMDQSCVDRMCPFYGVPQRLSNGKMLTPAQTIAACKKVCPPKKVSGIASPETTGGVSKVPSQPDVTLSHSELQNLPSNRQAVPTNLYLPNTQLDSNSKTQSLPSIQIGSSTSCGDSIQLCNQLIAACGQAGGVGLQHTTSGGQYVACQAQSKSEKDPSVELSALNEQCTRDTRNATFACTGGAYSNQVTNYVNDYKQARANGNINAACSAAKNLNAISMGANIAVGTTCRVYQPKCARSCGEAESLLESIENPSSSIKNLSKKIKESSDKCKEYGGYTNAAFSQAVFNAQGYAQSADCVKKTSGIQPGVTPIPSVCDGDQAKTNPLCIYSYCSNPVNLKTQICSQFADVCSQPANSGQVQCKCFSNGQLNPTCLQQQAQNPPTNTAPLAPGNSPNTLPTAGSGEFGDVALDELPPAARDLQIDGGKSTTNTIPQNGGGGFGAGGGSSGGSAGVPPGVANKPEGDPEVMLPTAGGAGQADAALSAGDQGGGHNGAGGGGRSDGELRGGFDLSKFLPGGEKDPSRGPASDSVLAANGISEANGLSNFEKVTRKMQEKRPELRK